MVMDVLCQFGKFIFLFSSGFFKGHVGSVICAAVPIVPHNFVKCVGKKEVELKEFTI